MAKRLVAGWQSADGCVRDLTDDTRVDCQKEY
jgi:hypothetical protein